MRTTRGVAQGVARNITSQTRRDWLTSSRENVRHVSHSVLSVVLYSLLLLVSLAITSTSQAQVNVVGASTSTSSTTAGARKTFYDSGSSNHWAFWYTGSQVEYASSSDASTWTTRGNLSYNTANFSVAFKVISGTSYVFLVTEANTYDIVIRRGTISGTTITFDSEVTVLDGTSASDTYTMPHVALDSNDKVWTAAFKDSGTQSERYQAFARRTSSAGSAALNFDSATAVGSGVNQAKSLSLAPISTDKMLLVVPGEADTNILAFQFDGSSWASANSGGSVGLGRFASSQSNGTVEVITVSGTDIYFGGGFTSIGGIEANYIAKWNGTEWSALGTGLNGSALAIVVSGSDVYVGGQFSTAGGVTVNQIARWNGTLWSALGSGTTSGQDVNALALIGTDLYAGGGLSIPPFSKHSLCNQQ